MRRLLTPPTAKFQSRDPLKVFCGLKKESRFGMRMLGLGGCCEVSEGAWWQMRG